MIDPPCRCAPDEFCTACAKSKAGISPVYVVRLDATGYYGESDEWKTVPRGRATVFRPKRDASKIANRMLTSMMGYPNAIVERE